MRKIKFKRKESGNFAHITNIIKVAEIDSIIHREDCVRKRGKRNLEVERQIRYKVKCGLEINQRTFRGKYTG